jgi:hypothetical protein
LKRNRFKKRISGDGKIGPKPTRSGSLDDVAYLGNGKVVYTDEYRQYMIPPYASMRPIRPMMRHISIITGAQVTVLTLLTIVVYRERLYPVIPDLCNSFHNTFL